MAERFDLAELAEVVENLRKLTEVPSRAAGDAADGISDAIQQQFEAGVDAYGYPWAELAPATLAKKQGPGILWETGDLRDGIVVAPMAGAGISITIDAEYAQFHQTGTNKMPARPILPDGDDMPDEWERAIEDAMENAFDRAWENKK